MTPSQILKALRRRLVPLAARGLTQAEMRRELAYTVRRFKLSEKVTSALMERVEGELSYVATRTVGADTRRAAVELVRPFAGPVSRLDGALLRQFERRVLPLVEKGARVSDVEARIRKAVGVTEVSAKTLAITVVAGADRAGSLLAAQEAGVTHFRYAGPPGERHFCSDLTRRSADGETWTLEQIRAMVNGHGLPVEFYCGGWRCRHRWVTAVNVPILEEPRKVGSSQATPDHSVTTPSSKPSGTPVSVALSGPKSGKTAEALARTLQAIDGVHGDGALPLIEVRRSRSKDYLGAYFPNGTGIRLASDLHPHMTLAHEIGHFIDHKGLPGKDLSSRSGDDVLDRWRKAVHASAAYGILTKRYDDAVAGLPGASSVRYTTYIKSDVECFARSYAQYIAVRSGDPQMLAEIATMRTGKWAARQWEDDDFVPIAEAFDDLFHTQGWITKTTD
ncbi:MAG: hypothetical protein LCH53_13560 [Bacteroidetes bacterium]|nr:hypothetical protein [Bacteroidota bacterium]